MIDKIEERALEDGRIERTIHATSDITGKANIMVLTATRAEWTAYDGGELIQNALPGLTADQREFLLTGITPDEWEAFIKDEDDEP